MRAASPILVVLALAGCVAPAFGPTAVEVAPVDVWAEIEARIGAPVSDDHDHADPTLHEGAVNLDLLALVTGHDGEAPATESYIETAVKGGYAYLSRNGPDQGLVVFDLADPAAPEAVGYLKLDAGFEPDIEVSDDGRWGFWETQRFPISGQTPALDPGANLQRGVHIVDLADKTAPTWVGFSPTPPDGPHSITYANVSGRHILFQSVYAFAYAYAGVEVPGAQRLVISELDTSGPVATLTTLAEYVAPGATGGPGLFPHDVSVQAHPITGQTLAYVAYWDLGVVILDVTDPADPVKVGQALDFGPAPYREIHMARAFPHLIAGRHITVAEPEIGGQPDSGYVTFLDTTDPTAPQYVSSWRLPGEITSAGGALGPHYFDVMDGRVALASYHAGFWVIDVHDEANLLRPRTAADALVNATGQAPAVGPFGGGADSAFDAWWWKDADGTPYVVAGDANGGLAVYRYTGPAPEPVTGTP